MNTTLAEGALSCQNAGVLGRYSIALVGNGSDCRLYAVTDSIKNRFGSEAAPAKITPYSYLLGEVPPARVTSDLFGD